MILSYSQPLIFKYYIQISKSVSDSDLLWPARRDRVLTCCIAAGARCLQLFRGNLSDPNLQDSGDCQTPRGNGGKWWSKQNHQENNRTNNRPTSLHVFALWPRRITSGDMLNILNTTVGALVLCIDSKPQAYAPFAIAKANGFPFRSESRKPSGSRA